LSTLILIIALIAVLLGMLTQFMRLQQARVREEALRADLKKAYASLQAYARAQADATAARKNLRESLEAARAALADAMKKREASAADSSSKEDRPPAKQR
jgi:type II secretory pathway pseudopilin PulG